MTGEHERIFHGLCKVLVKGNGRDASLANIAHEIDEDSGGGRRWLGLRLRQMASAQTDLVHVYHSKYGLRFGLTTDGQLAAVMMGYALGADAPETKPGSELAQPSDNAGLCESPAPEPVIAKPKPRPKPVQAECTGWTPRKVPASQTPDNRHPSGVAADPETAAVLSRATARTMLADTNTLLAFAMSAARQQMEALRDQPASTGMIADLDRIGGALEAGDRLHAMLANATTR